jgi:hypothetical protein
VAVDNDAWTFTPEQRPRSRASAEAIVTELGEPSMADTGSNPMSRRAFIQNGTAATVAAAALTPAASVAQDSTPRLPEPLEIPSRMLGKTGVQVTILNGGTPRAPDALERLLRFEYSRGVRFFDTAASYGTEEAFKKWFAAMPEVRPRIVLATKDGVARPSDMIKRIDLRLEALGTDYIDLLYFHALSGKAVDCGLTGNEMDWPKSKEMKETTTPSRKPARCGSSVSRPTTSAGPSSSRSQPREA